MHPFSNFLSTGALGLPSRGRYTLAAHLLHATGRYQDFCKFGGKLVHVSQRATFSPVHSTQESGQRLTSVPHLSRLLGGPLSNGWRLASLDIPAALIGARSALKHAFATTLQPFLFEYFGQQRSFGLTKDGQRPFSVLPGSVVLTGL